MTESSCKHCTSGSIHEGEPTGEIIEIDGHQCYVAKPKDDKYPRDKAVLLLTDIFGITLNNNKLLADSFGRYLYTVMPDYTQGDPAPASTLEHHDFDEQAWFRRHGPETTWKAIRATMTNLKDRGFRNIAAVGYCFGARYVINLAIENQIKCGAVNHPSMLQPNDIYELRDARVPMLFNTCGTDEEFPKKMRDLADQVFKDDDDNDYYKRCFWPERSHGFAVRGDFSNPEELKAHNEAFEACYDWIIELL